MSTAGSREALLAKLDPMFRTTCRTVLKAEVGGLAELKGFLTSTAEPLTKRKSSVSGEDVHLYYREYPGRGRFVSDAELGKLKAPELDINKMKDIDSLVVEVKDNFYYCGDKHLGKSIEVLDSDGVMDSGFVLESNAVYNSQYSAYSNILLSSKFIFGCTYAAFCNSMINGYHNYRSGRFFQSGYSHFSSDLYFCWHMDTCEDCMFSMGQRNARCMIGNVEFAREKYLALKEKLLGEIAEKIREQKAFPSIFEMAGGGS